MELLKKELVAANRYELEFKIDKETFEAAINNAYLKNRSKIKLPGFRPGKAPRGVIEKMYGKGVFYEDAINDCFPAAYEAAIKETDFVVVSRPEFDIVSIDDGAEVVLKAVFDVKPEATLKAYKGLEAEKEVTEVTDDMEFPAVIAAREGK